MLKPEIEAEYIERWRNWMLLENGPMVEAGLDPVQAAILDSRERFTERKLYFGCGDDLEASRYQQGWDFCDVRCLDDRVIYWDVLMGLPHDDGTMEHIRSKLTFGMFSRQQAMFVMSEAARVLEPDGMFELTYRNFAHVVQRYMTGDMPYPTVQRFLFGGGLYYGSRRKSSWIPDAVAAIADKYGFVVTDEKESHAAVTQILHRKDSKLRRYRHVPGGRFDLEGHYA